MSVIKIGLDAGHGLNTAGKQTPDGIKEWTLNDKVRDKVVKILKNYQGAKGEEIKIIHLDNNEGNTDESLAYRWKKYQNEGCAICVSIHHNALKGKWGIHTGVEAFVDKNPTAEDKTLANAIYKRLVKYTGLKGRGVKEYDFYVINQDKIPATLIEGGFMDSKTDYEVITSEQGQTAYAKAVAEGIIEYMGLVKKNVDKVTTLKPTTNSVLIEWQKALIKDGYKLKYGADGIWGNECISLAKKVVLKQVYLFKKNINLVKFVQTQLGVVADGKFGKNTKNAVKQYQKNKGLTADGIVGFNTWKKILGAK